MFKKLLFSTLVLGAVAGCQAQAGNQATATGAGDEPLAAGARPVADWRFSRAEMEDIASPTKLKWRDRYGGFSKFLSSSTFGRYGSKGSVNQNYDY